MFKKLNLKVLAIVFIVLLAIVLILNFTEKKKGDRSFKKELVNFVMDDVNKLIIKPKSGSEIFLERKEDGWKVGSEQKSFNADKDMIDNMLMDLLNIKSKRLAATSKEKWTTYEVTDSLATRVIIKSGNKKLSDLYIGKFSYQQPKDPYQRQGTMLSYVRLADEKNVHAVDGFLSMTFNRDVNSFRNKFLVKTSKENINKIVFNYMDSAFTLLKQENNWMINGLMADSVEVEKYLGFIAMVSNDKFVDDIDVKTLGQAQYSILIEGDNFLPVDLKVYHNLLDEKNPVLITSTFDKGTVFSGSEKEFMDKLFIGKQQFLK